MPNFLDEYLIRLGAVVDQSGMNRFQNALAQAAHMADTSAASIAKSVMTAQVEVVAGFAAMGGAAVGLADKIAMADQEYRLFALHMYASKDVARGLKVAMDALGQPLENIVWDKELNERAHQLMEDQRAMAVGGDFDSQMRKIRDIRFEFTRMEVELQYLGMHVVTDVMRALGTGPDELLAKLREFNNWVIKHMPEISADITKYVLPVLKDIKMIFGDVVQLATDAATLFDNLVGILSGDEAVQGAANFDKFARSVGHVVHWLALAVHYLTKFEGMILGLATGGGIGGLAGTVIGGALGIPGGPAGVLGGAMAGGATGTALGGAAGGLTGDIIDMLRAHHAGFWSNDAGGSASSGANAQTYMALAQQVAAKTGMRADLIWAQWAQETDNFKHIAAANNLAGVNVPGGTGRDYRNFDSLGDFGDYYGSLLSRIYPQAAGATNATDFAHGLKHGKLGAYYSGDESVYAARMEQFASMYRSMAGSARGGATAGPTSVTINVHQNPGEHPADLARRVADIVQERSDKQTQRNLTEWQGQTWAYPGA